MEVYFLSFRIEKTSEFIGCWYRYNMYIGTIKAHFKIRTESYRYKLHRIIQKPSILWTTKNQNKTKERYLEELTRLK